MFENIDQSYPFNNNFKHNLKTLGLVGMGFVLIVLYFQPFGINFLKAEKDGYFVLAAGTLSSLTLFVNTIFLPGILPNLFKPLKWTIRKEMIWNVWLFLNLFLLFFILVRYVRHAEFTDFPLFRTGALALLPLVLYNLINYNLSLKAKVVSVFDSGKQWFKEEKPDQPMDSEIITFQAENGKDFFKIQQDKLILLHSSGNYIEIFYKQDNTFRKKLFRQTLGFIEENLKDVEDFKKCHRCWLINTKKVKKFSGNSKGCFIILEGFDLKVPVSRNNVSFFREKFSQTDL